MYFLPMILGYGELERQRSGGSGSFPHFDQVPNPRASGIINEREVGTMRRMNRKLMAYLAAVMLAVCNPFFASNAAAYMGDTGEPATAGTMLADTVLVRPLTLVGTAVGVVAFVVTLPFSALGGNVGDAGRILVVEPAKYTFVRPLGVF
jgi:hypothetical protein